MAGLIQQNMTAPEQAPTQDMTQGQMAMGTEMDDMDEGPDPETDPGYQQAVAFAMEALYKNQAARDVAKALQTSNSVPDGLANTAYEIVSIVDERTDGAVPDELLVLFATMILEEVAEIGTAGGVDIQPADVALALKQMILRYLGEQGVDTTQLQQAMDQVDPEEFNRMAMQEGGEQMPEEVPA